MSRLHKEGVAAGHALKTLTARPLVRWLARRVPQLAVEARDALVLLKELK